MELRSSSSNKNFVFVFDLSKNIGCLPFTKIEVIFQFGSSFTTVRLIVLNSLENAGITGWWVWVGGWIK